MEMVREYKVKQQVGVKLYSDYDMYKKMFYLVLNRCIDEAEEEMANGTLMDFDTFMEQLKKEIAISYGL